MLKQSLIYLILSAVIIFFSVYAKLLFMYMDVLYMYINQALKPVFGTGFAGELMRDLISLMLIPLAIAALPALLYWLIKRKKMPYFIELTWFLWLIIAISSYLIR
jgi:hypothetical protein